MDRVRHQKLTELFLQAIELDRSDFDQIENWLAKQCGEDLILRRELEALIDAHFRSAGLLDQTPLFEIGLKAFTQKDSRGVGSLVGKYRIVREVGQGGMGIVYEAQRENLHGKPLAIKILKRGLDTDAVVARFKAEYKILAELDSPYIAHLYDIGVTDDGLPYFVMEFVSGQPIDNYCIEKVLSINQILQLFCKVCLAVQYAHQNLIVHRDIKPSNILVSEDGIPKLLDFGIAKVLRPETSTLLQQSLTSPEERILTPMYASPEQVRGERITTASDIYSLGVLLYKLLTGTFPYQLQSTTLEELQHAICELEPIKPSESIKHIKNSDNITKKSEKILLRKLSGDLDNIILLTLCKEPERRYSSVENFVKDIERYLQGLPVSAHRPTLRYRVIKFIKRRKIQVVSWLLVIASLTVGLSLAFWQTKQAEKQRQVSIMRTKEVREIANKMLKFQEEMKKLPGSTAARIDLINEAINRFDQLSQELSQDDSLKVELAISYRTVGDIQGRATVANLGKPEEALKSYNKSIKLFQQVIANNKIDKNSRRELAITFSRVGELLGYNGTPQAGQYFKQSQEIFEELLHTESENREYQRLLSHCYSSIGLYQKNSSNLYAALTFYKKSLEIREKLWQVEPNSKHILSLANSYVTLSDIWIEIGSIEVNRTRESTWSKICFEEAFIYNRRLIEISEKNLRKEPNSLLAKREMAGCLLINATALVKYGDTTKALKLLEQTRSFFEQLSVEDTQNIDPLSRLADTYLLIGQAESQNRNSTTAVRNLKKAEQLYKQLITSNPQSNIYLISLAKTYRILADVYLKKTTLKKALDYAKKAFLLNKDLIQINVINQLLVFEYFQNLSLLTKVLIEQGNKAELYKLLEELSTNFDRKIAQKTISNIAIAEYAWLLATLPLDDKQDIGKAVELAQNANLLSKEQDISVLYILANIYARKGDLKSAGQVARQFINLLPFQNNLEKEKSLRLLQKNLKLYSSN